MRPNGLIIGVLGLWLILSGIIGFGPAANTWNDIVVGVIVAILGFGMVGTAPRQGTVAGIFGLWMIISGFVPGLHTAAGARWDDIIVGVILAIAGFATPRRGAAATYEHRRAA